MKLKSIAGAALLTVMGGPFQAEIFPSKPAHIALQEPTGWRFDASARILGKECLKK
jgi:hypothetical protein